MGERYRMIVGWFQEVNDNFSELILVNVLWFIFTILIIPAPAALVALNYSTNLLAHDKRVNWRTFLEAMRRYFGLGWLWTVLNLGAFALIIINIIFYGRIQAGWAVVVQYIYWVLLVLWSLIQFFVLPFIMEQTEPRLRTALRNSVVALLRRPRAYLLTILMIFIILALSSTLLIPAWILITASLCSFLINKSLLHMRDSLLPPAENKPPTTPRPSA